MLAEMTHAPALRGMILDSRRFDILHKELKTVLSSCCDILTSDSFVDYALFSIQESNSYPMTGTAFYKTGFSALQNLLREFLCQGETLGIIYLEDAEVTASVLLSQLHGSWFMRRLLKIDRPTAREITDLVEIAMSIFRSNLSGYVK